MAGQALAYCGAPPVPDAVAWNFDPALIAAFFIAAAIYGVAYIRLPLADRRVMRPWAFTLGWLVLAASFLSPLCNLSVALFSVRIFQHMILVIIAAPLFVIGGVDLLAARAFHIDAARCETLESVASPLLFAFALWFWHMPAPYDATLGPHIVYWSMEISLLATSLLLWRCLLRDLSHNPAPAIAASLFTGLQMTGLGAWLVFAPRAIFSVHFTTTEPWGLSPMQDQQLGGLVMWLPFGLVLAAHLVLCVSAFLGRLERDPAPAIR